MPASGWAKRREGNDRRTHRPRLAPRRRRLTRLSDRGRQARSPQGARRPLMHQQAPRVGGQPLCLGVEKDDQALRVRGEGQVTFNNSHA